MRKLLLPQKFTLSIHFFYALLSTLYVPMLLLFCGIFLDAFGILFKTTANSSDILDIEGKYTTLIFFILTFMLSFFKVENLISPILVGKS